MYLYKIMTSPGKATEVYRFKCGQLLLLCTVRVTIGVYTLT